MKTSTSCAVHRSCSVRISSRPVRSPMCTSRRCVWPPNARWDMWPVGVRSKMPPHCSSSRTRSGASFACSSAIRQLLRYLPPDIVSWKCVVQPSAASTLPNAAAMPPSAMTVWALPSRDLQTSAVRAPSADDSIAARRPAPPAPITTTSNSCVSSSNLSSLLGALQDPRIVEDAGRGEPDVEVGEEHGDEADPGPLRVAQVEPPDAEPRLPADAGRARASEAVELAADQVPRRVAAERERREADHVDEQHERAEADAQLVRPAAGLEDERPHRVVPDEPENDGREVEEGAVRVLEEQRQPARAARAL